MKILCLDDARALRQLARFRQRARFDLNRRPALQELDQHAHATIGGPSLVEHGFYISEGRGVFLRKLPHRMVNLRHEQKKQFNPNSKAQSRMGQTRSQRVLRISSAHPLC